MLSQDTQNTDSQDYLSLYKEDIDFVLSQVSADVKERLIHILERTIQSKTVLEDAMEDLEYELFPKEYEAWPEDLPILWNPTYPDWYLFFRDHIVLQIFKQLTMDDWCNLGEIAAETNNLIKTYNDDLEKKRKQEEWDKELDELDSIPAKTPDTTEPPPF